MSTRRPSSHDRLGAVNAALANVRSSLVALRGAFIASRDGMQLALADGLARLPERSSAFAGAPAARQAFDASHSSSTLRQPQSAESGVAALFASLQAAMEVAAGDGRALPATQNARERCVAMLQSPDVVAAMPGESLMVLSSVADDVARVVDATCTVTGAPTGDAKPASSSSSSSDAGGGGHRDRLVAAKTLSRLTECAMSALDCTLQRCKTLAAELLHLSAVDALVADEIATSNREAASSVILLNATEGAAVSRARSLVADAPTVAVAARRNDAALPTQPPSTTAAAAVTVVLPTSIPSVDLYSLIRRVTSKLDASRRESTASGGTAPGFSLHRLTQQVKSVDLWEALSQLDWLRYRKHHAPGIIRLLRSLVNATRPPQRERDAAKARLERLLDSGKRPDPTVVASLLAQQHAGQSSSDLASSPSHAHGNSSSSSVVSARGAIDDLFDSNPILVEATRSQLVDMLTMVEDSVAAVGKDHAASDDVAVARGRTATARLLMRLTFQSPGAGSHQGGVPGRRRSISPTGRDANAAGRASTPFFGERSLSSAQGARIQSTTPVATSGKKESRGAAVPPPRAVTAGVSSLREKLWQVTPPRAADHHPHHGAAAASQVPAAVAAVQLSRLPPLLTPQSASGGAPTVHRQQDGGDR